MGHANLVLNSTVAGLACKPSATSHTAQLTRGRSLPLRGLDRVSCCKAICRRIDRRMYPCANLELQSHDCSVRLHACDCLRWSACASTELWNDPPVQTKEEPKIIRVRPLEPPLDSAKTFSSINAFRLLVKDICVDARCLAGQRIGSSDRVIYAHPSRYAISPTSDGDFSPHSPSTIFQHGRLLQRLRAQSLPQTTLSNKSKMPLSVQMAGTNQSGTNGLTVRASKLPSQRSLAWAWCLLLESGI